jgi:hypothetical protein
MLVDDEVPFLHALQEGPGPRPDAPQGLVEDAVGALDVVGLSYSSEKLGVEVL